MIGGMNIFKGNEIYIINMQAFIISIPDHLNKQTHRFKKECVIIQYTHFLEIFH